MAQDNSQKIKLLKLYELLQQETDEQNPLTTNTIIKRLEEAGISCERRTLAKDIALLNDQGYEVMTRKVNKENGYFVEDRKFSVPELKILIDAVQAASFITEKKTTELAGTAGYSIEDTAIALGLMANAGIKSTQAGTTLRQALMNLVSPTKSQKDAMDALGLSLTNSDGSMKTLDEVMQMLRQQFAGLSVDVVDADGNLREYEDIMADLEAQNIDTATAQKMQYAATIFGARGLSGMLAIVNATEESYQGLKDSIYATVDAEESAAQQMANIQLDNLNGQITLLKSALEGAAISIGEKLTPYIAGLVEKVQAAVDWFNGLTDAQVALIAKAILLVAAIAPVAKTISLIASLP